MSTIKSLGESILVYGFMLLIVCGIGYGASQEQEQVIDNETQYRQSCVNAGGRVVSAIGDDYKNQVMPENVEHATCVGGN